MANEIHAGDTGVELIVAVYDNGEIVDISDSLLLSIIIRKPDNSSHIKSAYLYTDGTDGKMAYSSSAGDFDLAGTYKIQGRVSLSGGTYYTSISSFKAHCNL